MAWTSAHFAAGMIGGGAVGLGVCCLRRRGFDKMPLALTLGGIWGLAPDLPRLFREDFPSLGLASTLGSRDFEKWLHSFGDLFFFHSALDAQPKEFALHGLFTIIGLYNLALLGTWWRSRRQTREQRRLEMHLEAGEKLASRRSPDNPERVSIPFPE